MSEHEASTENELFPSRVTVGEYREIFIWPFHLVTKPGKTSESQFDYCKRELETSAWGKPVPMLSSPESLTTEDWTPEDPDAPTYDEIVYFHPHVRDFLYGTDTSSEDKTARSMRRFRRKDLKTVEVQLTEKHKEKITLDVIRTELYLAKPLMGLLVLEVHYDNSKHEESPISFNDVLDLQQMLRQVYPPFFPPPENKSQKDSEPEKTVGGNCPYEVTFHFEHGSATSNFVENKKEFVTGTYQTGEPPVANHWLSLLAPLEPYLGQLDEKVRYQQFIDDRIPSMTFLSVDDPHAIADGDFFRLAYCDGRGGAEYFFSQLFLEENNADIYYDRFWDRTRQNKFQNTRFLTSGYHFAVVGASGNPFVQEHLPSHFRQHYFRMGLILHYQRAALLKFSDDLTHAIKECHRKSPDTELYAERFRRRIQKLEMDFTKFASRGWFPEVSNQLQAQELFALWSRNLRMQPLYDHVKERIDSLYDAMTEHESRRLTRLAYDLVPPAFVIAIAQVFIDNENAIPLEGNEIKVVLGIVLFSLVALLVTGPILDYWDIRKRRWFMK